MSGIISGSSDRIKQLLLEKKYDDLEKYISDLRAIIDEVQDNIDSDAQNAIDVQNDINSKRSLFNSLEAIYQDKQSRLTDNRKQLRDQKTITQILESELGKTETNIGRINSDKQNKIRLVEIGNSETARYEAYTSILKTIVYASIVLIGLIYVKMTFFVVPKNIMNLLIALVIVYALFSVMYGMFDIYSRDSYNFNKYAMPNMVDTKMTADRLNMQQAATAETTTGTETSPEAFSNYQVYNTDPQKAQAGTVVKGVFSEKDIETFAAY